MVKNSFSMIYPILGKYNVLRKCDNKKSPPTTG